jgi:hypothetical protein
MFLPEYLDWRLKDGNRSLLDSLRFFGSTTPKPSNLQSQEGTTRIVLRLNSMSCIACSTTVQNALNVLVDESQRDKQIHLNKMSRAGVVLEKAEAWFEVAGSYEYTEGKLVVGKHGSGDVPDLNLKIKNILATLEDVGFPGVFERTDLATA